MVEKNLMKTLFSLIFFSPKNPRTVLGLSPERRLVSSFVHAKEDKSSPKPHTSKKVFGPSFALVSHSKKFSLVGEQNYGLFMVVAQTRLDRIRARVCCNSNSFKFQLNSNFLSSLSDQKRG